MVKRDRYRLRPSHGVELYFGVFEVKVENY